MTLSLQMASPRALAPQDLRHAGVELIGRAPEIRIGLILAGLFGGGLLAAGLLIPLDAAVTAPGVVKVSGERRSLQSNIDGTVAAVTVRDGSKVRAGQILLRFDLAQARAVERALADGARTPDLMGPEGGTPITTEEMGDAILKALDASL